MNGPDRSHGKQDSDTRPARSDGGSWPPRTLLIWVLGAAVRIPSLSAAKCCRPGGCADRPTVGRCTARPAVDRRGRRIGGTLVGPTACWRWRRAIGSTCWPTPFAVTTEFFGRWPLEYTATAWAAPHLVRCYSVE